MKYSLCCVFFVTVLGLAVANGQETPLLRVSSQTPTVAENWPTLSQVYHFPVTDVGSHREPQIFVVTNQGTGALNLSAVSLSGEHEGEFTLDTTGMSSTLGERGQTTFLVTFRPQSSGIKNAVLTISSNDERRPLFNIPLRGRTPQPRIAVSEKPVLRAWTAALDERTVVPIAPEGTFFTAISVGTPNSQALLSDGRVTRWDANLSIYPTGTTPPAYGKFIAISSAWRSSMMLTASGNVLASSSFGLPGPLPEGLRYIGMSPGYMHSLVFRSDGRIMAQGSNDYGQTDVPELPEGLTYTQVAAGYRFSVALRSDGSAVAWGDQTGIPPLPSNAKFAAVACYQEMESRALFLRSDGAVVAYPDRPPSRNAQAPSLPPDQTYTAIAAGQSISMAMRSDGQAVIWPHHASALSYVPAIPSNERYSAISAGSSTAVAIVSQRLASDHGRVRFHPTLIDSSTESACFVHNDGNEDLRLEVPVLDGADASAYTVTLDSTSVTGGSYTLLKVRFTPSKPGEHRATLRIPSNDPGQPAFVLQLVGQGLGAKRISQSLTFAPPSHLYWPTEGGVSLQANSSSGLPVLLQIISEDATVATLSDSLPYTITPHKVGTIRVRATQPGDSRYLPAKSVTRTIEIRSAPTKLTLTNLVQTYDGTAKSVTVIGAENAQVTYLKGDEISTEPPVDAGSYPVTASVQAAGKIITTRETLVIQKAVLRVRVHDQLRSMRMANPDLSQAYTLEGLLGSDLAASVLRPEVPLTISTSATLNSLPGLYPISSRGGAASNYRLIHIPATLQVVGFGSSYEALLSNAQGVPVGLVRLTVSRSNRSFTAQIISNKNYRPIKLSGLIDLNSESRYFVSVATSESPFDFKFKLDRNGQLSGNHPDESLFSKHYVLPGHGQMLRSLSARAVNYAGLHTVVFEPGLMPNQSPILSNPEVTGSGWASGIINKHGRLTMAGTLGDGKKFTCAVSADLQDDPGYRMFIQPYQRSDSFMAGTFQLKSHPNSSGYSALHGRRYLPESVLRWIKSTNPADETYEYGFGLRSEGPLEVTMLIDPWIRPSQRLSLSSLLKISGNSFEVKHRPDFTKTPENLTGSLPTELSLSGSTVSVIAPVANVARWKASINADTGFFNGSYDGFIEETKKVMKFSGILRQPDLSEASGNRVLLLGAGYFLIPPYPASSLTAKPTTGDLLFQTTISSWPAE